MEQRYLSPLQASQYLGLSKQTIYIWAEEGKIPGYKVGRVWRFDREELDSFVRKASGGICYNKSACREVERKEGVV
ncbi:MAG TPA: helix-turn-helix domain-containing protein [Elusimicrobiota bacterium]|nr:helix-turn-helix domain-containing protein [Elusimicrobiota bacterium]